MKKNVCRSSGEVPILMKLKFSGQIFGKYSISWKSVQWGADLLHTGGRTDRQTWRTCSGFSQFCERTYKFNKSVSIIATSQLKIEADTSMCKTYVPENVQYVTVSSLVGLTPIEVVCCMELVGRSGFKTHLPNCWRIEPAFRNSWPMTWCDVLSWSFVSPRRFSEVHQKVQLLVRFRSETKRSNK